MLHFNDKVVVWGTLNSVVAVVSKELEKEGFSVLGEIDLCTEVKKRLGRNISPTMVLEVYDLKCVNQAFRESDNVIGFLPCQIIIRQNGRHRFTVDLIFPSGVIRVSDGFLRELFRNSAIRLSKVMRELEKICDCDLGLGLEDECWNADLRWGLTNEANGDR